MSQFDAQQIVNILDDRIGRIEEMANDLVYKQGRLQRVSPNENGFFNEAEVRDLLLTYEAMTIDYRKPSLSLEESLSIIRATPAEE